MPGVKTNERPGTRAVLRHYRMSATKARQVLDLVRGHDVDRAHEILRGTPREAARVVAKVLASAVANARHNDGLEPEELYVSACYADEGTTVKRWRPRARGRATRIRKRTCHITVIVSRLPEDRLARRREREAAGVSALRARRVAASRRGRAADETAVADETAADDTVTDEIATDDVVEDEALDVADDTVDEEPEAVEAEADTTEEAATGAATEAEVVEEAETADVTEEEPAEEVEPAKPARRSRRRSKAKAEAEATEEPGDEEND
jgi:large subunit ribosomal protein L22